MANHVLDELTWKRIQDYYFVGEQVFYPYRVNHCIQAEFVGNLVLEQEKIDLFDDQRDPGRNRVLVAERDFLPGEVGIHDHYCGEVVETSLYPKYKKGPALPQINFVDDTFQQRPQCAKK